MGSELVESATGRVLWGGSDLRCPPRLRALARALPGLYELLRRHL
jgi:hypothetical protein